MEQLRDEIHAKIMAAGKAEPGKSDFDRLTDVLAAVITSVVQLAGEIDKLRATGSAGDPRS